MLRREGIEEADKPILGQIRGKGVYFKITALYEEQKQLYELYRCFHDLDGVCIGISGVVKLSIASDLGRLTPEL